MFAARYRLSLPPDEHDNKGLAKRNHERGETNIGKCPGKGGGGGLELHRYLFSNPTGHKLHRYIDAVLYIYIISWYIYVDFFFSSYCVTI